MDIKKSSEYRIYSVLLTVIIVIAVALAIKIDVSLKKIENQTPVVIHDVTLTDKSQKDKVTVYITPSGKKYHHKNCEYLGEKVFSITKEEAKKAGFKSCTYCKP